MEERKPIHTLVLDTGAIIKNEPPVSTLLKQCESLVTIPAILSEIKDAATRSRVETTLRPFLTLLSPGTESIKFVTEFARRTGDLVSLSKADLHIIAATYEIECERNGGDWRLRRVPGQKGLNGAPPAQIQDVSKVDVPKHASAQIPETASADEFSNVAPDTDDILASQPFDPVGSSSTGQDAAETLPIEELAETSLDNENSFNEQDLASKVDSTQNSEDNLENSGSDSEGWITPSNLKKKQAADVNTDTVQASEVKVMQAAVLTTDFAMQNVILRMNLNLLSSSLTRVKHLKTFVFRCHACFQVTKDMSKQFCPRCGQPSLTRVSCSTDANGQFKLHLKKNMQWNHRGDRYSIPKPVSGSANGRVKGGGKDGWGNELILTEDQKEYQAAVTDNGRRKVRDLMDEDYLPSILTGDRGKAGGKIKVGAGRNINSRKR